jgi:hypothetical protein
MSFTPYATDYYSNQQLASGETCLPRECGIGSTTALVSGNMPVTYFTAQKSEVVNQILGFTGNVAAGATPTFCAMGWYSVDALGNLTQVGGCANDTTLFAAAFTTYTRPLITPFLKQAGQRYAYGLLCISAAAMPTLSGYNGAVVLANVAPRLSGIVNGQVALPTNVPVGSVSNATQVPIGAVTP